MKDYSAMSDSEINIEIAEIQYPESQKLTPYKHRPDAYIYHRNGTYEHKDYCNNPSDAWVIILENKINIDHRESIKSGSMASQSGRKEIYAVDKNPLRAAMIVFLMMKDEAVNTQGEKS